MARSFSVLLVLQFDFLTGDLVVSLHFDIETEPLPDDQLLAFLPPFEAPPHPGEFDPLKVKLGNIKDHDKRTAKVLEAQSAHAAAVENHSATVAELEKLHWENFKGRAALDPLTGRVLAIGYYSATKDKFSLSHGPEKDVLAKFWEIYQQMRTAGRKIVGCNSLSFDLPFLIRRSWILGIDIPSSVMAGAGYFRFDPLFVDVRNIWLLGQKWGDCPSSLDVIARALGCGQKPEGLSGQDFARLWHGTPEERQQAVEYLRNDVDMTAKVAVRLGVV